MIDLAEIGPCSTASCHSVGLRARGAADGEHLPLVKSFYCDECVGAAAQRSFTGMGARAAQRMGRNDNGLQGQRTRRFVTPK